MSWESNIKIKGIRCLLIQIIIFLISIEEKTASIKVIKFMLNQRMSSKGWIER